LTTVTSSQSAISVSSPSLVKTFTSARQCFREILDRWTEDSQAADARLRALFPNVTPLPLDVGLDRTVARFHTLPGYPADLAATAGTS
jgi:hypothetical protein